MSKPEEWRPFPGWPYEVSSHGRVRSLRTGVILVQWISPRVGYAYTAFRVAGIRKNFSVHRLVAIAFHGNRSGEGLCVAHNDGDRRNNHADNLRWATMADNHADKKKHGTWQCGERASSAKLTADKVLQIRARHAAGERFQDIAPDFGVVWTHVRKICIREIWKHIE